MKLKPISELTPEHGNVLVRVKGIVELRQCTKSAYKDFDGEEYVVANYGDYHETIYLIRDCIGFIQTPLVTNLKTQKVVFTE